MSRSEAQLGEMRSRWRAREDRVPSTFWWRRLYQGSEVQWARVFTAAQSLWLGEKSYGTVTVLWSPDPYVACNPQWLDEPRSMLLRMREPSGGVDGGREAPIAGWSDHVELAQADRGKTERLRLPPVLSARRVVYLETLLAASEEAPNGLSRQNVVPIVVTPGLASPVARMLPPFFWPASLRHVWNLHDTYQPPW